MATGAFRGWPASAMELYRGLEAENTRAYWLAHKATYDADVAERFVSPSSSDLLRFSRPVIP